MWFKDIENWSQSKLKTNFLIYGFLYFVLVLIVPTVIIGTKYNLIKSSSLRLTGMGLILVVFIAVFLLKGLKRLLNKLPQDELKEQRFKFIALLIYSLMLPVGGILLLQLIKQNVTLACDTISYCLYSIIAAIVLDHLTLKFLEVEWDLRQEAKHQIAVNKRIESLK